jgi:alkyldihydroxyacetonephosphate synthase
MLLFRRILISNFLERYDLLISVLGHYSTVNTHIDDFVENLKIITPSGIIQTPELPASGAGPNANKIFAASEGVFGVITEVALKVQKMVK